IKTPEIVLDKKVVRNLKKSISREIIKDQFGYETITLKIQNSNSFFEFLYTPQVQNFEKTKYKVENLEELYVFVKEFLRCRKELEVRYCEVFVSAYKREHQQIFYNAGFKPRGYIPSWKYSNRESVFKDSVLFSISDGNVSNKIQLIEQGFELLQTLGIAQFSEAGDYVIPEEHSQQKKERYMSILFNPQNLARNSLRAMMSTYLLLLFLSLIIAANITGFNITLHAISDLGNSLLTPVPFLFDTACGVAGAITIPFSFYISRVIGKKDITRDRITSQLGLLCGIIGGLGYMGVGIFSLDRSGPEDIIHNISAVIAFTGFVFCIFFFSIPALLHHHLPRKLFGVSGIGIPLLLYLCTGIFASPLLEWLLLFSILFHIVPLNYWSVSQ
ncbi:MAG: DUF998 domain-containing protein, partial [Candidatus Lokiarchaeota archaeon]|nr:DUF998 domain-containing protein [Candidatus Lokiarchaeota archaeon]